MDSLVLADERGDDNLNISPMPSVDSPHADNVSQHKAQLHEKLNAVATLSPSKAQLEDN
jgi:hypothetical protein